MALLASHAPLRRCFGALLADCGVVHGLASLVVASIIIHI